MIDHVRWGAWNVRCLALGRIAVMPGCHGTFLQKVDLRNCQHYLPLPAHQDNDHALATSPTIRLAASADKAGNILLWTWSRAAALRWLGGHEDRVETPGICSVSGFLATARRDCTVRFWEVSTGKELVRFREEVP